jgi:beta-lactamase regulating signal transducer with metallopeptidase domain
MTSHFESFARVAVLFGLALLAMPLLVRRSASARRLVLAVTFAFVLVVPFLPAWHVSAPAYRALVGQVVVEPIAAGIGATGANPAPIASVVAYSLDPLTLVWTAGVFIVAARLVIGLVVARRLVGRASRAPIAWETARTQAERQTGLRADVRVSSEIEAPVVTGIVSPVVLVPVSSASWTDERRLSVLLHELAHVAAHDLAVQVLATIACSLHWFNPLAWCAARRLRLERELAADEAVLRSGMRASTYAEDLLAIAGAAPAGTVAIGEKPLASRIAAILAEQRPAVLGPKGASALVIGTVAIALGVACTTTSGSPPVPASASAVDAELHAVAAGELRRTLEEWKAPGGTILVLSPKGEVLAEAGHVDGAYVVGSTMKPLLLAAAIDEGVVTESDVFDCSHNERGGKVLQDPSELGQAPLAELVSKSSNVGFAQIFDRLGGDRFDRALHRFHFATPPELAAAPAGDWNGGLLAIGATMSATPRQIALAYAALANGGDGIVKPSTAARVTTLLEGVVASDEGTGKKARVAGVRVAGKTGTSEWTAPDGRKMTYASFVGYVPAERPRYVIFVGVESPSGETSWGGDVAAPVFARIAAHALRR